MGKILNVVCIMMMIIAVFVIGGEAKSEAECNVICRPHCKPSSSAGECSDCHKDCNQSPPSVRTKILKIQNSNKQYDLHN
ncbi:PREDICTED: uncharacterized protein LOC106317721 [Brassica oleracea var. oleracea]|uniref:Uncharacterized protein n=1 Tax=Brassica oleracea var. oleracea TaxID=109376 RepID=A0A0D3E1L5_BRAOL|nr:PREDICTED: uncharacterized protein LOC106317721 [Brassica oleracea var. oleracea]